jgi:hypothetical protein
MTNRKAVTDGDTPVRAAAVAGPSIAPIEQQAVQAFFHHDIDDSGDGVGSIDGGLRTRENINVVNELRWYTGDTDHYVGTVVQRGIGRHGAAVDEKLGVLRQQTEQAQHLCPDSETSVELPVLNATGGVRGSLQGLGDVGKALVLQILGADHGHRGGELLAGCRNQRAADDHLGQGCFVLCRRFVRARGLVCRRRQAPG